MKKGPWRFAMTIEIVSVSTFTSRIFMIWLAGEPSPRFWKSSSDRSCTFTNSICERKESPSGIELSTLPIVKNSVIEY